LKPNAAVSIDVDTLSSIYKGRGCRRPDGYTFLEFRQGLETISNFFGNYEIKTTLFMVGKDFEYAPNHAAIRAIHNHGHEIANHSMTHPQGFRWLSAEQMEEEIQNMSKACEKVIGMKPVGFRSPGWNIGDSAIEILKRNEYIYDSSVFPTYLMPIMKFSHWASMSSQPRPNRTTMGRWRYMFAPLKPYPTSKRTLARRGADGIIEFPVSVTPILRIPFFATLLLFTGNEFYERLYKTIHSWKLPIHFQMHLSDFVDYSQPELEDQMPERLQGSYVPQALTTSLEKKLEVFSRMMDRISTDYHFLTLKEWASQMEKAS
jgi:hypothetical protein